MSLYYPVITGESVSNLPTYNMTRVGHNSREWEVTIPATDTKQTGPYKVSFRASYLNQRVANPSVINLSGGGADPDASLNIRALLAVGNSSDTQRQAALALLSRFAYEAFYIRFQDHNRIDFLSPHVSPVPLKLPGAVSAVAVRNAINSAANQNIDRLYIHLAADSDVTGTLRFRLPNEIPNDYLIPTALDQALDTFQAGSRKPMVILSIDGPGSGAFLQTCKATGSQKRIVVTAGSATDPAVFLSQPELSFTQRYLSAARTGATILQSFEAAQDFFRNFMGTPGTPAAQPQFDDGVPALSLGSSVWLGRRYAFGDEAAGLPFVLDAFLNKLEYTKGEVGVVSAILVDGVTPLRVYARLLPPGTAATAAAVTSTSLVTVQLQSTGLEGEWAGLITAPQESGDWKVSVWAEYANTPQPKLSEPVFADMSVTASPETPDVWESAPYNDSSAATTQNRIVLRDSQRHTLHNSTDVDWGIATMAAFNAQKQPQQQVFTISISNISLAPDASLRLDIYENGPGAAPTITRLLPASLQDVTLTATGYKALYWRVSRSGTGTGPMAYRISMQEPTGANNGIISQIGGRTTNVPWPSDGSSSIMLESADTRAAVVLRNYSILREDFSVPGQPVTSVAAVVPPQPDCNCPASYTNQTGASNCHYFSETLTKPVTPSTTDPDTGQCYIYNYRVYANYSDGTSAQVGRTIQWFVIFENTNTSAWNPPPCQVTSSVGYSPRRQDDFSTGSVWWQKMSVGSANLTYDAATGSIRAFVPSGNSARIVGWRESEYWMTLLDPANYPSSNELKYADVGPTNWIRAKFHIFAQTTAGTPNVTNLRNIPSARLRIAAPLFSFGSFLDVMPHNSGDAISNAYALDMTPTTSSVAPRVYRVDMDPPEFSWTAGHPTTIFKSHVDDPTRMGYMRMFEAFSRGGEPQEQGFLCLAESSIGTYPAIADGTWTTVHEYGLDPQDWTTPGVTGNIVVPGASYTEAEVWEQSGGAITGSAPLAASANGATNPVYSGVPAANDIVFSGSSSGFDMNTIAVDNRADPDGGGKYAVAQVNWYYGNKNSTAQTRTRAMPQTLYRTRFTAGATVASSVNGMIRFRCSGINNQFNPRLEIGGSTGATEFSWGYLPGNGSAFATGAGNSGVYDLIFVSPFEINPADMNLTIGNHLGALPAQGQADPTLLGFWRELHPGVDIIDEYIADPSKSSTRSKGQITITNIKVQSTPLPPE